MYRQVSFPLTCLRGGRMKAAKILYASQHYLFLVHLEMALSFQWGYGQLAIRNWTGATAGCWATVVWNSIKLLSDSVELDPMPLP